MPANQDQLNVRATLINPPDNVDHNVRSVSSEQDNSSSAVAFQPQSLTFGVTSRSRHFERLLLIDLVRGMSYC